MGALTWDTERHQNPTLRRQNGGATREAPRRREQRAKGRPRPDPRLPGSSARGRALEGRGQGGAGRGHQFPGRGRGRGTGRGSVCPVRCGDPDASGGLSAAAVGGERPSLARQGARAGVTPGSECGRGRCRAEGCRLSRAEAEGPLSAQCAGRHGVGCRVAAPTSGSLTLRPRRLETRVSRSNGAGAESVAPQVQGRSAQTLLSRGGSAEAQVVAGRPGRGQRAGGQGLLASADIPGRGLQFAV